MAYYARRLAQVHATDFTMYARAAARLVRQEPVGVIIDVGCGAGDLCGELPGWEYVGIDSSPDMLAIAAQRYPDGRFDNGDALTLPDRPATVIVAIGEVLNYATDLPGLVRWLHTARQRLTDGGLLLFDVAGPTRAEPEPRTTTTTGVGYRLDVTVQTDPQRQVLTRTIELTDAEGTTTEVHTLHLMDPLDVMAAARRAGFEVTALDGYDDVAFTRGWSGFSCRVILDT